MDRQCAVDGKIVDIFDQVSVLMLWLVLMMMKREGKKSLITEFSKISQEEN